MTGRQKETIVAVLNEQAFSGYFTKNKGQALLVKGTV
jgi:hypothetical protein